jgi:hypothetical protein
MSIDSIIASNPKYQKAPAKSNVCKRELHEWASSRNFSGIICEIRWFAAFALKMIGHQPDLRTLYYLRVNQA